MEISISSKELSILENLGHGVFGNVYALNDQTVIKIIEDQELLEEYQELLGIENEVYVFPQFMVKLDGRHSGYTMKRVYGKSIKDNCFFRKLEFSFLIDNLKQITKATKDLNNNNICLNDIKSNHIYFNSRPAVIDNDQCYYSDILCRGNLKFLNSIILDCLKESLGNDNKIFEKYILNNVGLLNLYKQIALGQEPSYLLFESLPLFLSKELNNMDDVSKTLIKYNKDLF